MLEDIIGAITSFIFVDDPPGRADVLFIPGCSLPEPALLAARLWREGLAPCVLPSGKYSVKRGFFPGPFESEWAFMRELLTREGVPEDAILREDEATYTWENARLSRQVTDARGLRVKTGLICCQAYHARRCLQYYQLAYPEAKLIACPVVTGNISRDNWTRTPEGIDKVLGELERCGGQFSALFKQQFPTTE